jgi:hypothetical protein
MRALAAVGAALSLLVIAGCAGGQQQPLPSPPTSAAPPAVSSLEAAQRGLETMRGLAHQGSNYATLGFASQQEADTATLDAPMHIILVRLDQLLEYRPGGDPAALLSDTGQDFYPVLANGQTRSSLIVGAASGQRYTAASFGGATLARTLAARRDTMAAAPRESGASEPAAIVHVAALNLYFLGYQQRGRLMLVPAVDNVSFGLRAGLPMPAATVFAGLAERARTMRFDKPS